MEISIQSTEFKGEAQKVLGGKGEESGKAGGVDAETEAFPEGQAVPAGKQPCVWNLQSQHHSEVNENIPGVQATPQ
jgi:hypothetical protein